MTSVRTVVTSCLRIETEALATMDHNVSLESIQLPTTRTFWNCNDPSLDPFDVDMTLVPAMASTDEACSSTFQHLFPIATCGDSSTCDESEPILNTAPPPAHDHQQSPNNITFGGALEADQSSLQATAQSYCTNDESSLFTWSLPSSPPHYNPPQEAGELGAGDSQGHYDGGLDSAIFGPLSSDQGPFLKVPQPSSGAGKERNSWQFSTMSGGRNNVNIFHHVEPPLGSPCSVISGFTKALQEGDRHYNMASMSHIEGGLIHATDQSISETHHVQGGCGAHKRKRSKGPKHSSEVESQRMTHIAVERNRRKQMNEHLAALRALMPGSYVQKSDQASIVGGAIEFVKELEHLLVCLQSQKRRRAYSDLASPRTPTSRLAVHLPDPQPISQIIGTPTPNFALHGPQSPLGGRALQSYNLGPGMNNILTTEQAMVGEVKSEVASVEVRMVPGAGQAVVKVMAVRRSGQLLRTVVALESLALTVVHANITTVNHTVLYSFQAHYVGALCRLTPQDVAAALHQTFSSLHSLQF